MEPWIIVGLVVLVLIVVGLRLLMPRARRQKAERNRTQAREHLQDAQVRSARAESERAAADEQAARARRERAEAEERVAGEEREARERAARAEEEHAKARGLEQRARELAPDLVTAAARRARGRPTATCWVGGSAPPRTTLTAGTKRSATKGGCGASVRVNPRATGPTSPTAAISHRSADGPPALVRVHERDHGPRRAGQPSRSPGLSTSSTQQLG